MKRALIALAVMATALQVPATADAAAGEKWLGWRTLDVSYRSAAVGETLKIRLLLPKGWKAGAKRKWPVVYAFQGGADDYTSWTRETDIEQVADRYGVIVAMPAGGDHGSYTNWWNDGKGGTPRWETFHTRELPKLLKRYQATGPKAVIGVSSGGQGAMSYAARHPGMFRYAASFSGATYLTKDGMQAFLTVTNLIGSAGASAFKIFGVPGKDDANWRAHDPFILASKLRGTELYVSSGTTGLNGPFTPPGSQWRLTQLSEVLIGQMNLAFVQRLRQLKIPVTSHIYGNGWHAWPEWTQELHTVWPKMMKSIGAKKTKG